MATVNGDSTGRVTCASLDLAIGALPRDRATLRRGESTTIQTDATLIAAISDTIEIADVTPKMIDRSQLVAPTARAPRDS
jgi:hypothetical protein